MNVLMNNRFLTTLLLVHLYMPSLFAQQEQSISAEIIIPKNSFFQYETFKLTLRIKSTGVRLGKHMELQSLPDNHQMLLVSGFNELPIQRNTQNNVMQETRTFTTLARAMSPGPLTIAPLLRLGIVTRKRAFIGYSHVETPRNVKVSPVSLAIRNLPPVPGDLLFSGAVGTFDFTAHIDPSNVAVGDIITTTLKVQGNGYVDNLSVRGVTSGKNFKIYDAKPVSSDKANERLFQQMLVPQSKNALSVPAVSFTYFDPSKQAYKTISKGPFPLIFHAAKEAPRNTRFKPQESPSIKRDTNNKVQESKDLLSRLTSGFPGPENMITDKALKGRFAPSYSAIETFDIPEKSSVEVFEIHGTWIKIEYNNNRGWIPSELLKPL